MARILAHAERSAVGRSLARAVEEAMEAALDGAGLRPEDVGWLSLSAGGKAGLDAAEIAAARAVFGPGKPCAALKAVFGETFGAAGALSAAAAAAALAEGIIPATPRAAGGERIEEAAPGVSPRVRLSPGPVLVSAVEEDGATALLLGR
jgi:3-oxoacyl-(acyl-carrier-protein) synthase